MEKEKNQPTRDLEEIWGIYNDPIEIEKRKLKERRKKRDKEKKEDAGL